MNPTEPAPPPGATTHLRGADWEIGWDAAAGRHV